MTGTALLSIITVWLKQRKGRRVEIERHDHKVKAPSARELQKARDALHNYDELTLALDGGKPPKEVEKKGNAKTPEEFLVNGYRYACLNSKTRARL